MKLAGLLGGLILIVLTLPFLLPSPPAQGSPEHLPWNVKADGQGGSHVFGLSLPGSTLADAVRLHGPEREIGLIMDRDEALALEAYLERVQLGFVTGRLILTVQIPPGALEGLVARAPDSSALQSGARRLALAGEDQHAAMAWPISAITFIPSVNLDASAVLARFGEPLSRVAVGESEHLLYPDRGLDILLDPGGRELLQYVAPSEFARLSGPLEASTAVPTRNHPPAAQPQ